MCRLISGKGGAGDGQVATIVEFAPMNAPSYFWQTDTFRLLRIPFSVNLLPMYLFAVTRVPAPVAVGPALLVFVILHLLVYPASNGYNSYMDRDETPIGGLEHPPLPTVRLFRVTLLLDAVALGLALWLDGWFAALLLGYVLASRAYSYRGIRLKKYPILGFLTVFIFQGGYTVLMAYQGVARLAGADLWERITTLAGEGALGLPLLIGSLLVGGGYPLTQVYQHVADRQAGDQTLSLRLGYRGTFVFAAVLFGAAFAALGFLYRAEGELWRLFWLLGLLSPVLVYFHWWAFAVWRNPAAATFGHTMRMNLLSAACLNAYFLLMVVADSGFFL